MSRKLKYLIFLLIFGLSFWILSGKISSSKEKSVPTSIWTSFSEKEDKDRDGLKNEEEKKLGTDPENPDTDGDKILDGIEVKSGYDPLKKMSEDEKAMSMQKANSNSNNNGNINNNTNASTQNKVLINNEQAGNVNNSVETQNLASLQENLPKTNYTEATLAKTDEIVAKYKLYSTPYENLDADTKAKVEKDVAEFIETMLNQTGLDFAFNVPESRMSFHETELSANDYLVRVKSIFRKHGLAREDQTIEDGMRDIISTIREMSKTDIDWGKVGLWKQELLATEEELSQMSVPVSLKELHIRVFRITGALNIVLKNMEENDYFKAFISAGRVEKVNEEVGKFVEEVEKFKNK